jgi:hypothetical protein
MVSAIDGVFVLRCAVALSSVSRIRTNYAVSTPPKSILTEGKCLGNHFDWSCRSHRIIEKLEYVIPVRSRVNGRFEETYLKTLHSVQLETRREDLMKLVGTKITCPSSDG